MGSLCAYGQKQGNKIKDGWFYQHDPYLDYLDIFHIKTIVNVVNKDITMNLFVLQSYPYKTARILKFRFITQI